MMPSCLFRNNGKKYIFEENDFFLDEDVFLEEEDFFSTLLEDFSEESFGFAV